MKFSLAATSIFLLSSLASLARGDAYADAIEQWCQGLSVTSPQDNTVGVAGGQVTVTVTRVPDQHQKEITGLDLYSVSSNGQAQYVQNVWTGSYALNQQASISASIPQNATAGLYYYRVWVTNDMNGMHGPDCIETSHTFKVSTAVHTNSDGISYYAENLEDEAVYHPDHFRGCFGLTVDYPKDGQTTKIGDHVRINVSRDKTSQTKSLLKVDLYKEIPGKQDEAQYVDTIWEGNERFTDQFTLKDHFIPPEEHISTDANYYYVLTVSSSKSSDECKFSSGKFKIASSN